MGYRMVSEYDDVFSLFGTTPEHDRQPQNDA